MIDSVALYDRFNQNDDPSVVHHPPRSTHPVTHHFLIIADDLSGAADCAAGFVSAGFDGAVLLGGAMREPTPSAAVVTVDTDSRRDPGAAAAAKARAALEHHGAGRRVIKKIDSTLRGGWAAEVAALQPLLGLALVAPAFPGLGRIVRDGMVRVDGVPLAQTSTWTLEHAGRESRPVSMLKAAGLRAGTVSAELLEGPPEALLRHIARARDQGCQALVVDAEQPAHLRALASATRDLAEVFWVASAGLAHEIARCVAPARPARDALAPPVAGRGVLTIVGSLSPIGTQQIACLGARPDCSIHTIPARLLRIAPVDGAGAPSWAEAIHADLARGLDPVACIGADADLDPAEGPLLARRLALRLAPSLRAAGGLVLTGGETARIMLEQLGIARLQVLGESEPGVVLLRSMTDRPQCIATKAGAFGDAGSLERARQALRSRLACAAPAPS